MGTPVCEDTWLNAAGCTAGVLSGLLSCEKDFCDTPPTVTAPCGYTGQCDLTCSFCTASGDQNGHRRTETVLPAGGHRRLVGRAASADAEPPRAAARRQLAEAAAGATSFTCACADGFGGPRCAEVGGTVSGLGFSTTH